MTSDEPGKYEQVRVVLIHHDDPERLRHSRHTVEVVAESLAGLGEVEVREVARQPGMGHMATATLVGRHWRQWRLEREWARYLGRSRRWILSAGLLILRLLQLLLPGVRVRANRRAQIELILSSKHELAWRSAYEDGVDTLVVLEDDAWVRPRSIESLRGTFTLLRRRGDRADLYVDLAGGISMRQLRLDASHLDQEPGGLLRVRRPGTNTACAYMVGSAVLEELATQVVLRPQTALLPADWMINRCFMDLQDTFVVCLHTEPSALIHGSMAGLTPSSVR